MEEENRVPNFYINEVDISHSGNDLLLEMRISNPKSSTTQANIYISPQHAKRLLYALGQAVKSFENMYGTINISTEQEEVNNQKENDKEKNEE